MEFVLKDDEIYGYYNYYNLIQKYNLTDKAKAFPFVFYLDSNNIVQGFCGGYQTLNQIEAYLAGYCDVAIPGVIALTKQPANVSCKDGEAVSFSVAATGTDVKYQWQKSTDGGKTWVNSSSAGATTDKLSMTAKAGFNGYMFRCKLTDAKGRDIYSDAAALAVAVATSITAQPKSISVVSGATAAFTVTATGTGLRYQWQKQSVGSTSWVNSGSTGATTNKLSMTTKDSYSGLKFRCQITDASGKVIYSNAATLTVTPATAVTAQPKSISVVSGATAAFTVTATGTGLKYQWQKQSVGSTSWVNSGSTGATTNKLSMTTKDSYNGLKFRCQITDANGKVIYTNAATLTVTSAATAITAQPKSVTVAAGSSATFTVKATGTGLKYQWQKQSVGSTSWVNSGSTGATTDTLQMTTKESYNGLKFRCKITDASGKATYSNAVTLTVVSGEEVVVISEAAVASVKAGETAKFKVSAIGTGLKYQWQKQTVGSTGWVNSGSTGATTDTLSMVTKASYDGLKFRCKITNAAGKTVYSSVFTLTVK